MEIFHDKIRNTIYITQQQYIESIVELFRKYGISEIRTSMDGRQHYSKTQMPKSGSAEALQRHPRQFELPRTQQSQSPKARLYCPPVGVVLE